MLMSELQSKKELLSVNQICVSHPLNNSGLWGLGNFLYGSILRASRVYEARRFKGVGEYISKKVVLGGLDDSYISGETAQNYLNAIEIQYRQPAEERDASVGDEHGAGFRAGG